MPWECLLGDTVTGLLDRPIDLPSFSWGVSVSDSSLSTNRESGAGTEDWSGVTVPWTALREAEPSARSSALSPLRRCLVLLWDGGSGPPAPVLWGAIGHRSDTWLDTSFSLDSVMSLLSGRFVVGEGDFGAGPGGTSPSSVRLEGLSRRAIASEVVRRATLAKPGGELPIDIPYLGERGAFSAEYRANDVQNLRASDIIEALSTADGGPDIQFRPYLADASHVRLAMVAGSDGDPYLGRGAAHALTCFPGGGTIQNLRVDRASPVMRVYATGSGSDAAQVCHLSEDLSLSTTGDPWPLVETACSEPDVDRREELAGRADAALACNRLPLMQISGEVDFRDPRVPPPGSIWPGEPVEIAVEGFPTLPDGVYRCRLMEMRGSQSARATLTFDVTQDPIY